MTTTTPIIVLDLRTVQDHFPGIGRCTFHLAQALAETAPAWRFVMLTQPGAINTRFDVTGLARRPNVTLHAVSQAIFSPQEQITLPRDLPPGDLVHFPYYIFPYLSRRRAIVTIYDIISHLYPAYLPSALHRVVFEITTRLALARAAHILTLSTSAAADLQRVYGVDPGRITVTPAAADGRFRPASADAIHALRRRLGLPPRYVLFLGANKPHKNLLRLVEAWAKLKAQEATPSAAAGVSLVLAGREDPRYVGIRAAIAQAGLQNDILVLGAVSEADLPVLYSGAEVFILPSLYEGYGLPVIEAMACGVAVACSNTSSLPEVVGGDAGVLFDPADSDEMAAVLRRLLTDGALRTTLQQTGLACPSIHLAAHGRADAGGI
ncbi:glycosyltransferase family 1 protein [Candidatus Amarolinea dominans]|uniref:glycosyltransferase family 4 protein n=1 Tax=Candidatus Amarolinea dominans TaxID=3140696 RepID=UPI003135B562|nr:glycosyltransferase family 4 protein [Anaerolineae bacterium]